MTSYKFERGKGAIFYNATEIDLCLEGRFELELYGAFCGISLLVLGIGAGVWIKTALGHRIRVHWIVLSVLSIPLWMVVFLVSHRPLDPILLNISDMRDPPLYGPIHTIYPVAGVILFVGITLTAKTTPQRRLITAVLSLVLAATPVAITATSLPIYMSVDNLRHSRAMHEIDSHVAIWQENRPHHYRYSFQFSGMLARGFGVVWASEVDQGEPTLSVQDDMGLTISRGMREFAGGYATIDDLFTAMHLAIETEPYFSIGDYDPDFGYPNEFSWGTVIGTDSIATIRILNFEVMP